MTAPRPRARLGTSRKPIGRRHFSDGDAVPMAPGIYRFRARIARLRGGWRHPPFRPLGRRTGRIPALPSAQVRSV